MKTKQAFTLIELLVVTAVIGVLAAISVASFQNALFCAQYTQVITDLKMYGTAFELAFADIRTGAYPHEIAAEFQLNVRDYPLNRRSTGRRSREDDLQGNNTFFWGEAVQFKALTTPISYITTVSAGPWSEPEFGFNYRAVNGFLMGHPSWFNSDFDISASDEDHQVYLEMKRHGDFNRKGWYVASKGPDNQSPVFRYFTSWFDPTNGLNSTGCVWYDFLGTASWASHT